MTQSKHYPQHIDLEPVIHVEGAVRLPGSKSISNRTLLLAALSEGTTLIHDLLASDDTMVMLGALRSLGSSSRVVTVFEDPEAATDPTLRAARQGVTGLTRSIAHEMRRGGTANGLVLGEGVPLTAPGAAGALAT